MNNPAAVAIHEASLLWPGSPIQCIVSCGTGRTLPKPRPYEPHFVPPKSQASVTPAPQTSGLSLLDKMNKVLESATDTEGNVFLFLIHLFPL